MYCISFATILSDLYETFTIISKLNGEFVSETHKTDILPNIWLLTSVQYMFYHICNKTLQTECDMLLNSAAFGHADS